VRNLFMNSKFFDELKQHIGVMKYRGVSEETGISVGALHSMMKNQHINNLEHLLILCDMFQTDVREFLDTEE
jgi:hypothetical protein